MRKTVYFMITGLLCAVASAPGSGVTVITHGFNSSVDGWGLPMCRAIRAHPEFPGTNYSLWKLTVTKPSSGYAVAQSWIEGASPSASDSGEIVIALDWSAISGLFNPSTAEIAGPVAAALLSTNLLPQLNGRALAELPLHLIGHSRGASLMAEVARILGAQGVWVDHLTLLDPYPLSLNGDPTVRNYANVFFTENFRQNDTFPEGQIVGGSYDRLLTMLGVGGYTGGNNQHSDVHLWYHGTMDLSTPLLVDSVMITGAERVAWWAPGELEGANAGFRTSRIVGGNRFSPTNPAGSAGAVSDGINKVWDLGAGQNINRSPLPSNNGTWPNIVRIYLENGNTQTGEPGICRILYQHGTGTADVATLKLFLDADRNPWNTNEFELTSGPLPGTGTTNVLSTAVPFQAPASLQPGPYRVFAKVGLGTRSRYIHAQEHVISPPVMENARVEAGALTFTIRWLPGSTVVTESSEDLLNWTPILTNSLSAAAEPVSAPATGPHAFYRLVTHIP